MNAITTLQSNKHNEIEYLLTNMNYERMYAKLTEVLAPDELAFLAQPTSYSSRMVWHTELQGRYRAYPMLSEEEKDEVSEQLDAFKRSINTKLSNDPYLSSIAETLLIVPSEREILLFTTPTGTQQVILVQWGCQHLTRSSSNVVAVILGRPKKDRFPVTLQVGYSDGIPYAAKEIILYYKNRIKPFKTNKDGQLTLGRLKKDTSFSIAPSQTTDETNRISFTVTPTEDIYEAIFPYYIDFDILVLDQENTPVPNLTLQSAYNGRNQTYTTSSKGRISIRQLRLQPNSHYQLTATDDNAFTQNYTISRTTQELIFNVHRKQFAPVTIKVLDDQKKPVEHYELSINAVLPNAESEAGLGASNYKTDNHGIIQLESVEVGSQLQINSIQNTELEQIYEVHKGENEIILQLPPVAPTPEKEGEPEPEEPIEEIPESLPPKIQILLVDHKNKPLPDIKMDFEINSEVFNDTTDKDGKCYLTSKALQDKQKIQVKVHTKKKNGTIKTVKKYFKYRTEQNEYTIRLKKNRWWLLLFLLPLAALFIPVQRSVDIEVVNGHKNIPIDSASVLLNLENIGQDSAVSIDTFTNNNGKVRVNLYSEPFILTFFRPIKGTIITTYQCFKRDTSSVRTVNRNLIKLYYSTVKNAKFKVIHKNFRGPIPEANIYIVAKMNNEVLGEYKKQTDLSGEVVIKNLPQCAELTIVTSKQDYITDTTHLLSDAWSNQPSKRIIELSPIMQEVRIFVKDKDYKIGLVGAVVRVQMKSSVGDSMERKQVVNTSGEVYFSIIPNADNTFRASLVNFHDTTLRATTKKLAQMNDATRTMYLRPKTKALTFKVVHRSTDRPIENAKVVLKCGNQAFPPRYTDRNGNVVFGNIRKDCQLEVQASKNPFIPKSISKSFQELTTSPDGQKIPLDLPMTTMIVDVYCSSCRSGSNSRRCSSLSRFRTTSNTLVKVNGRLIDYSRKQNNNFGYVLTYSVELLPGRNIIELKITNKAGWMKALLNIPSRGINRIQANVGNNAFLPTEVIINY